MAIDRTNFNALVDDDGSNTTGSVWDKDAIENVLLDPIDAAIAAVTAGPGGANTQVQFNDSGVLAGDSGMVFNKTTNVLTLLGQLISGGTNATTLKPALDVSVDSLSLANNAVATLTGSGIAVVVIYETSVIGNRAVILVTGSGSSIIHQTASNYSVTQGTASSTNVSHSSGNLLIENKLGGTAVYRTLILKF